MSIFDWIKSRGWHITLFKIFLPSFYRKPEKKVESPAPPMPSAAPAPPLQPSVLPKKTGDKRKDFIESLRPLAQEVEAIEGIPWLLLVTQAAHESRYGQSDLTREANNLFGITGESWKRKRLPTVEMLTSEHVNNEWIKVRRPFRKYASYKESIEDWLSIIKRLHPNAYHAAQMNDGLKFFVELQKSGYATDPEYAMKLDRVRGEVEGLA